MTRWQLITLAALLAAVAVALGVRSPAALVRRAMAGERTAGGWLRVVHAVPGLAARPDAPPLRRRLLLGAAGGVGAGMVAAGVTGQPVVGAVLSLAVGAGATVVFGRLEPASTRRRRERLLLDLPATLDLLGSALAGGLPLRLAAARVAELFPGPVAEEFGRVLADLSLGADEAEAWRRLSDDPQLGRFAADLARSVSSGTRVAATLHQHGRDARRQRRAALEARARTVGVRSVLPLMTCFLPAFFLIGIVPTVVSALISALS